MIIPLDLWIVVLVGFWFDDMGKVIHPVPKRGENGVVSSAHGPTSDNSIPAWEGALEKARTARGNKFPRGCTSNQAVNEVLEKFDGLCKMGKLRFPCCRSRQCARSSRCRMATVSRRASIACRKQGNV